MNEMLDMAGNGSLVGIFVYLMEMRFSMAKRINEVSQTLGERIAVVENKLQSLLLALSNRQ